jgi:hypothetical protein
MGMSLATLWVSIETGVVDFGLKVGLMSFERSGRYAPANAQKYVMTNALHLAIITSDGHAESTKTP